jgi:N-acetylglucosaminyldiphosphoundecaprenol N-acetyl-beta-D-mannosaminyltransferase
MNAFCRYSVSRGYRHFFYGGANGVAEALGIEMANRYPGLDFSGHYSPPSMNIGTQESKSVIDHMNSCHPDVVWVSLGTPKQDYWLAQHRQRLEAPVLVGVGAAFDFITGRIPQAPTWMQRSGLEWFFRLVQEPRRLGYRYLVYNPLFIALLLLQLGGFKKNY